MTVKISSLPRSIQNDATHLPTSCICAQLSIGPIKPKPGPILPIAEAEAVKEVTKSRPVKEKTIAANMNINI